MASLYGLGTWGLASRVQRLRVMVKAGENRVGEVFPVLGPGVDGLRVSTP